MNTLYELPTAGSSSQPYLPASRDHGFKHSPSKIFGNLRRTLTPGKGSRLQGDEDGPRVRDTMRLLGFPSR
jgi:hypothetical protein